MRRKFRKRTKPKEQLQGLAVKVYDNNVESALKVLKRKVKNSGLMVELRKKQYFEKPSDTKRYKKNLAILRNKYKVEKEKNNQ